MCDTTGQAGHTHSPDTSRVAIGIFVCKLGHDDVQRVYEYFLSTENEGQVNQGIAWDRPVAGFRVVVGSRNTAVNGIRHGSRDLRKRVPRIYHSNELVVWS